jgi:KipI family sensor histidine kinase inhibitor
VATLEPFGDAAILVTLGDAIDDGVSSRVHALAAAIGALRGTDARLGRPVPGFATVLVPFDPLRLDPAGAIELLAPLVERAMVGPLPVVDERPPLDLPTRYGGADGPDLDDVAERNGLTAEAVIALHAGTVYRVAFIGFLPGFAYLGPVPEAIATPRRSSPRGRVPAGSVGIADRQTGIYPFDSPGGWQLIGRTDVAVWDPTRDPPAILEPGRRVRFVRVRR